jgi:hypothetical protein
MKTVSDDDKVNPRLSMKNILIRRANRFYLYTKRLLKTNTNFSIKDFFKYRKIKNNYEDETINRVHNFYEDLITKNKHFLLSLGN